MKELFFLMKKKTLANILHKLLSVIHSKKKKDQQQYYPYCYLIIIQ